MEQDISIVTRVNVVYTTLVPILMYPGAKYYQ